MADLVCNYSLDIKEGDVVEIRGESAAEPLIKACFEKLLSMGCYPVVRMNFTEQLYSFYKYAGDKQLEYIPEMYMTAAKTINGLINIDCEANTKQLTGIDSSKIAKNRKALSVLKDTMFAREAEGDFSWVIAPYPTSAMAQDAEMSLKEYSEFVFGACKLYEDDPVSLWQEVSDYQSKIVDFLTGTKELRIMGEKTDLIMNVEGRKWINCNGKRNMPDGEVFTSPLEESGEGEMFFDVPTSFMGVNAKNVHLFFEKGRVVKAEAEKGEKFLNEMLDTDDGGRIIGEIAFGLNKSIKKATANILFDEKIGESMHLAVGSSYPEAGGKNKSGLHWDLIKDMRKDSQVFADNIKIYENGKFIGL